MADSAVWVYDPKTKHVYQGFPFEGLTVLDLDASGAPTNLPADAILPDSGEPTVEATPPDEAAADQTRAKKTATKKATSRTTRGAATPPAADETSADTKAEEASK